MDKDADVFMCYAGEDRDGFVGPLVDHLTATGVLVWYDRKNLTLGDTKSKAISEGMRRSRYAIAVISKYFVAKTYPDHEYHTLLAREIESGDKVVLPILYGNITLDEVRRYSEPLANKYYLRAEDYTLDDLVSEVLRVVKPLTAEATAQAETGTVSITATAYIVGQPGVPTDALPRQPHLAQFQPCLTFQFSQPQAVNGKFYLEWVVKNIGLGAARKVKSFLPGVFTDKLESPIEAGANASRGVLYENKRAFTNFMKPPVHLIAEYEDIAGNIYRQYGNLIQSPAPSGAFNFYGVEEMGTPYLISERIVKA